MAKKDFIVHIDLNKNELQNARLQVLGTAPSATAGDLGLTYYNSASKTVFTWIGTDWIDLGSVYTHPTFPGTAQPTTALTGANVISQITVNNGHVTGVTTRALTAANIGAATAAHTHAFSDIIGLPANTILANNTGATASAKAVTVANMLVMLGIAYGSIELLTPGTDTSQRTWSAKMISDFVMAKLGAYVTVVNLAISAVTATTVSISNTAGTGVDLPAATATLAGVMTAADKAKLNGIAVGANNYIHPTDNPGTNPFSTLITNGLQVLSQLVVNGTGHVVGVSGRDLTAADIASVMINDAINNGTVTTWSSGKIFQTVQDAIDQAQTGALQYKGEYNPVTNTPAISTDPLVKTGWTYVVSAEGTFLGRTVSPGDMLIAKVDNPGNNINNWQVVRKDIPTIADATTLVKGIIQLATNAEGITGTDNTKAITAQVLKAVLDSRVGGYAATFGNGSAVNFVITHSLNTQDVIVQVQRVSDRRSIEVDWTATAVNTITIDLNIAPSSNQYRVVIKK